MGHRVGEAGQAVADDHSHIGGAAVLQLGEHLQPVLATGAVAGVFGPRGWPKMDFTAIRMRIRIQLIV